MPRQKWINKKTAQTFTLVHRSQHDPLIHDEDASQMVFKETAAPNAPLPVQPASTNYASSLSNPYARSSAFSSASSTISSRRGGTGASMIQSLSDLESDYGYSKRKNEGEAAMYGIYYDDSEYDYMQHMREIGVSSEAIFIEAPKEKGKKGGKAVDTITEEDEGFESQGKDKGKMTLEQLLEEDTKAKNDGKTVKVQLPADVLPSDGYLKRTYRDQQDVPDTIAGFQPDMDPRLREVLEALDDDAYVEDEEDFFGDIAKSGEVDDFEFERSGDFFDEDDDDEGWESDVTEKAYKVESGEGEKERREVPLGELPPPELVGADETAIEGAENDDWQKEFAKFKKDKKKAGFKEDGITSVGGRTGNTAMSFGGDDMRSLVSSFNNRKLKKKGVPSSARSMTSSYSMSSSALFRTEGLTTLDDRFDKIEEEYAEEDEDDMVSQSSVLSNAPERQDFGNILDEFLDSYNVKGKKNPRLKRGKQQSGMEQLDEIRRDLGRPRVSTKT